MQGVALGTLDAPSFAAATGYIAFFTLTLYVAGLILLAFVVNGETTMVVIDPVVNNHQQLSAAEPPGNRLD